MTKKQNTPKKEKQPKKKQPRNKKHSKNTLEDLVDFMTDDNMHADLFADDPVGKERFWLDDDAAN